MSGPHSARKPMSKYARGPQGQRLLSLVEAISDEDPDEPLNDLSLSLDLGVTESTVSELRRCAGIPRSALRSEWEVDALIARCRWCTRSHTVEPGRRWVWCVVTGRRALVTGVRMRRRR